MSAKPTEEPRFAVGRVLPMSGLVRLGKRLGLAKQILRFAFKRMLSPDAKVHFQSLPAGPGGAENSKVEDAILDLARGEFTIRRILDMIPEPDVEILRALTFLADLGSIEIVPH